MSGPAIITGFDAFSSESASASIASGSGAGALATWRAVTCSVDAGSASASQSSIGIETNAGPFGGVAAVWIARASACGTSAARAGSKLDLTSGCGMRIASRFVRFACMPMCGRTCWPAVTRSGEWFACALKIPPIALPTPGAVWRFAWPTVPDACA